MSFVYHRASIRVSACVRYRSGENNYVCGYIYYRVCLFLDCR